MILVFRAPVEEKMKESWNNKTFEKQFSHQSPEKVSFPICRALIWSVLLLAILIPSYIICGPNLIKTNDDAYPISKLSSNELRSLMFSVINGSNEFEEFINGEEGKYFGELQLLDKDYRLLWSKNLDEKSLRNWDDFLPEVEATFVGHEDQRSDLRVRQVREARFKESRKVKKYVVSSIQRAHYVNCDRFRPVRRGKYLVSPSINALHTCYRTGITLGEMEHGGRRTQVGRLRYDLDNLYVPCEVAFDPVYLNDLTDDLRDDFFDCGWSGSLENDRRVEIERRFAVDLATGARPSNLMDPRGFVECSHVDEEEFQDHRSSPSYEALRRCRRFGVTAIELERGISANARRSRYNYDVASLFLSCNEVFDSRLEYLTGKLRDDYLRCKEVGAISHKARRRIEEKFYESLAATKEKTTVKPTRTAFAN